MNYRVVRIEEDVEFGCEERKEGDPVMAVVRLEDEDGDVKSFGRGIRCCMTEILMKGIGFGLMKGRSW
mgnify:CR=1 FL=1